MSLYYKALYRIGLTPWEDDPTRGPAAEQIGALFDREEEFRGRPYGKALDLGCGSGIWSVQLAKRGWDVTGVDMVPKALPGWQVLAEDAYAASAMLPTWMRKIELRFYRLGRAGPKAGPEA